MRFRGPVTRTKHLLTMRTIANYFDSCRRTLSRVGSHLWLGRRRAIGGDVAFFRESGDVVDDLELTTLLGGPEIHVSYETGDVY